MERQIDRDRPTLENLVDYLIFLHGRMANIGIVNNYFGELKNFLHPSSVTLLQNPIFKEMLHACRYKKLVLPKLPTETWDPELLLDYMLSLPPNEELEPMVLTGKLLVLMMLASGRRKCDMLLLQVDDEHMKIMDDAIHFALSGPSKGFRHRKEHAFMQHMVFQKYPHPFPYDKVCPYKTIWDYIRLICNRVSYTSPHDKLFVKLTDGDPPSSDTLKRWGKDFLSDSGVFAPTLNSLHSASSSKMFFMGVSLQTIMDRCAWAKSSTFIKFYLRTTSTQDDVQIQQR